jgi:hypothetical protein
VKLEDEALSIISDKDKPKYRVAFVSSNAITLTDKIQLITRFFGSPESILASYDFIHCTNYWTSWDNTTHLNQGALEALLAKELRYIGSKYPICSLFRLRKFIKRGFYINAGHILKIALQIGELDLKNATVLRDQLIGVDCTYFRQVIERLSDSDQFDSTRLIEIINEVFD